MKKNEMRLRFLAVAENEAFARLVLSAFIMPLNPTVEQNEDVKTAVSEAVTNAIIHGYNEETGEVEIGAYYDEYDKVYIEILDMGKGIADLEQAMEPMYTSRPDLERSGMGFTVMENFMDRLYVESKPGKGTRIFMEKKIGPEKG